jgi:hypothetical protein
LIGSQIRIFFVIEIDDDALLPSDRLLQFLRIGIHLGISGR